jgi:hypothetical protein
MPELPDITVYVEAIARRPVRRRAPDDRRALPVLAGDGLPIVRSHGCSARTGHGPSMSRDAGRAAMH